MSTQHVLPKWLLEVAAQYHQPPADLGSVASTFLGLLYTDPQWIVVQHELERFSAENSVESILRRQEDALLGVSNRHRREPPDPVEIAAIATAREEARRSIAAELEDAAEALRARGAEIVEQISEAARAAEQAPRDSSLRQAAARIARTVANADVSKLGPYWTVIVLYWLIVHLTTGELN
jgi:hypothetical protein